MLHYKKLFWIGIRESEIRGVAGLFDGSITIFGSNRGTNYSFEQCNNVRINYNQENKSLNAFINRTAEMLLKNDPETCFLLYYPMEAVEYGPAVTTHAVCINDPALTDLLENKLYTKLWLSKSLPVIPFSTIIKNELNYDYLCDAFQKQKQFVLQGTFSCGGSGTWLISDEKDIAQILPELLPGNIYSASPYIKNSISVNIHLIIYPERILLFPISVQLINVEQHNLCYQGADYKMVGQLPSDIREKVCIYANIVGTKLQAAGYLGICGIDFLTTKNEVYLMEINARFQSSSFLINEALKENHCPSLQELNIDAFNNLSPSWSIPELSISKSFYSYSYCKKHFNKIKYIWSIASGCPEVHACIDDAIQWDRPMEDDTYLYKLVFNTNIASVSPDYSCRLYNGFDFNFELLEKKPWYEQPARLKVLLLNQGLHISRRASEKLNEIGGVNWKEFAAVDLTIEHNLYINVPYRVSFSEISAFEVDYENDTYCLNYYGKPLCHVTLRPADPVAERRTKRGVCYSDISYLGVDRLRIHQRAGCYFKDCQKGCRFCGIDATAGDYTFEDIKEVLDAYACHPDLRHYLVGGGAQNPNSDFSEVLQIVRYIRRQSLKNIYLMSIPPKDIKILEDLKEAGVTEVSFNLEVFERKLARKLMPGKGLLPLEWYDAAFKKSVNLWGRTGNVRSALIVGLEPKDSLLQGVEYLCKLGVAPILSLFKPDSNMEDFWAPSSQEIFDVWRSAEDICKSYGVLLGPSCHVCEDNVLKISLDEGISHCAN